MSGERSADVLDFESRRRSRAQAMAVEALLDAGIELLHESTYDALTLDAVSAKAGLSAATATELFASTDDLIIGIYLRRIRGVALCTTAPHGSIEQVAAQLSRIMLAVAEEPAVATACAAVFLGNSQTASRAQENVTSEIHRLIATAVGPGSWPEVVTTLELIFSGALIQAAAGTMTFQRAAERVETAVSLIIQGVPQQ